MMVFPSSARAETATPSIGFPSEDFTVPLRELSDEAGPFAGDNAINTIPIIAIGMSAKTLNFDMLFSVSTTLYGFQVSHQFVDFFGLQGILKAWHLWGALQNDIFQDFF